MTLEFALDLVVELVKGIRLRKRSLTDNECRIALNTARGAPRKFPQILAGEIPCRAIKHGYQEPVP